METTLCPRCQQPLRTGEDGGKRLQVCIPCAFIIEDTGDVLLLQKREPNTGLVELFEAKLQEHCPDLTITASNKVGGEQKVSPGRRMRWDYVIEGKVAIEVDGHVHRIRGMFDSDVMKHNVAMTEGWKWLRCNRALLSDDKKCTLFFHQLRHLLQETNPHGN